MRQHGIVVVAIITIFASVRKNGHLDWCCYYFSRRLGSGCSLSGCSGAPVAGIDAGFGGGARLDARCCSATKKPPPS